MWSLGCIASEIFLGLPLFPGTSEYNQLSRIIEIMGYLFFNLSMPPSYMLQNGKSITQFFNKMEYQNGTTYSLKSLEQYMKETSKEEQTSKKYFKGSSLPDIINSYPIMRKGLSQHEIDKEMHNRRSLIDFLQGVMNLNPIARWSPEQARRHPFITGEPFTGSYCPNTLPPTSPSRVTTLMSGEVREIRGARSRAASSSTNSTVQQRVTPIQYQPLPVEPLNPQSYSGLGLSGLDGIFCITKIKGKQIRHPMLDELLEISRILEYRRKIYHLHIPNLNQLRRCS